MQSPQSHDVSHVLAEQVLDPEIAAAFSKPQGFFSMDELNAGRISLILGNFQNRIVFPSAVVAPDGESTR